MAPACDRLCAMLSPQLQLQHVGGHLNRQPQLHICDICPQPHHVTALLQSLKGATPKRTVKLSETCLYNHNSADQADT